MFPCFIPFSNVCNPSHASQRLYVFGCLATFACFPALGIDLMSFPSLRFGCIICLEFWFPFGVIHFCCVFRGGVGLRVGVIFLQKWRGVRGILENNIFLGHDFSYLLSQEKYITFTSHPIKQIERLTGGLKKVNLMLSTLPFSCCAIISFLIGVELPVYALSPFRKYINLTIYNPSNICARARLV